MKRSANQSLKCGNDGEKSKSQQEILTNADHTNRGKPTYKKTGIREPLIKFVPGLQEGRAVHSVEAPHQ